MSRRIRCSWFVGAVAAGFVFAGAGAASATTYNLSGLVNGSPITGTFDYNGSIITNYTFYLPSSFPNPPAGNEMDQTNSFIGVISSTYFQFERDYGGYADILNLQFNAIPGTLGFSSLVQYPDLPGANADYIAFITSGVAAAPATTPLPASGFLFLGGLAAVCSLLLARRVRGRLSPTVA